MGSAIFDASGIYCVPFFVFAALLLLVTPLIVLNFDSSLDTNREIKETEIGEDGIMKQQVGAIRMMGNKRVFFAAIA
jgi:hypothetical protein